MNYQLGVIPVFPARVVEGVGIDIQRANGVYTFALDYNSVPVGSVANPSTTYVLVQQPDGTYAKVPISNALTAALPALMTGTRNALINGGFSVWQRNTSFVPVAATRTYTADRWAVKTGAGTLTSVTRSTPTLPARATYVATITGNAGVTTVDLDQRLEASGLNYLRGPVTFSALVTNTTGAAFTPTLFVETPTAADNWATSNVQNNAGAGDALQSIPSVATVRATWSANIGSYTNIANGLAFRLRFPSGSLDANTKSVGVSEVQVEAVATVGDPPSLFEVEAFSDVLARCQRYYEKSFNLDVIPGTSTTVGNVRMIVTYSAAFTNGGCGKNETFKVVKRMTPTIVSYSTATGATGKMRDNVSNADVTPTIANAGHAGFEWSAGATTSSIFYNMSGQYTADAEL